MSIMHAVRKQLVRELGNFMTRSEQRELLNNNVSVLDLNIAEAVVRRAKLANRTGDDVTNAEKLLDVIERSIPQSPTPRDLEKWSRIGQSTNIEDRRFENQR